MSNVRAIFENMPDRYITGKVSHPISYYFSVGDQKWTATLHPDHVDMVQGRQGDADCVLKCDPKLFEKMVIKGKMPGPLDIARGKIKSNSPGMLADLKSYFRFG